MKVDKQDLLQLARLKKLFEDGTFPLRVQEIKPFSEVYAWISEISGRISTEITKQAEKKPVIKKQKKKVAKSGDNSRQSS